jgi:hypothetical protein
LQSAQNAADSLAACHAASQTMGSLYERDPGALQTGIEFANRLGWEADAALAAGHAEMAVNLRKQQIAITQRLSDQHHSDARALKANMLSQLGAAKLFIAVGRKPEANAAVEQAETLALELAKIDPENSDWQARIRQIDAIKTSLK